MTIGGENAGNAEPGNHEGFRAKQGKAGPEQKEFLDSSKADQVVASEE